MQVYESSKEQEEKTKGLGEIPQCFHSFNDYLVGF